MAARERRRIDHRHNHRVYEVRNRQSDPKKPVKSRGVVAYDVVAYELEPLCLIRRDSFLEVGDVGKEFFLTGTAINDGGTPDYGGRQPVAFDVDNLVL